MIYEDLATEFAMNGWHWSAGNDYILPTAKDIESVVEDSIKALHASSIGSTVQVGRLIIVKEHNAHGVYIYRGDVK